MHYNGEGQGRECGTTYLGQMTEEEHDDDDGHQSQRLPLLSALHHRPPAKWREKEDDIDIIAHHTLP